MCLSKEIEIILVNLLYGLLRYSLMYDFGGWILGVKNFYIFVIDVFFVDGVDMIVGIGSCF